MTKQGEIFFLFFVLLGPPHPPSPPPPPSQNRCRFHLCCIVMVTNWFHARYPEKDYFLKPFTGDLRVLWGPLLPASEVDSWQLHFAPVFFFFSLKFCGTERAAEVNVLLCEGKQRSMCCVARTPCSDRLDKRLVKIQHPSCVDVDSNWFQQFEPGQHQTHWSSCLHRHSAGRTSCCDIWTFDREQSESCLIIQLLAFLYKSNPNIDTWLLLKK